MAVGGEVCPQLLRNSLPTTIFHIRHPRCTTLNNGEKPDSEVAPEKGVDILLMACLCPSGTMRAAFDLQRNTCRLCILILIRILLRRARWALSPHMSSRTSTTLSKTMEATLRNKWRHGRLWRWSSTLSSERPSHSGTRRWRDLGARGAKACV